MIFFPIFSEVVAMKAACGKAHMKSILAIGELGSMNNVYKEWFDNDITLHLLVKLRLLS